MKEEEKKEQMEQEAPEEVYCVCRGMVDSDVLIECSNGTGGCNGWVHPTCVGLTSKDIRKVATYICPACQIKMRRETPPEPSNIKIPLKVQKKKGGVVKYKITNDNNEESSSEEDGDVLSETESNTEKNIGREPGSLKVVLKRPNAKKVNTKSSKADNDKEDSVASIDKSETHHKLPKLLLSRGKKGARTSTPVKEVEPIKVRILRQKSKDGSKKKIWVALEPLDATTNNTYVEEEQPVAPKLVIRRGRQSKGADPIKVRILRQSIGASRKKVWIAVSPDEVDDGDNKDDLNADVKHKDRKGKGGEMEYTSMDKTPVKTPIRMLLVREKGGSSKKKGEEIAQEVEVVSAPTVASNSRKRKASRMEEQEEEKASIKRRRRT